MTIPASSLRFGALVGALLAPSVAHASTDDQPSEVPQGTVGTQAPASSGTTEIEGAGKFGSAIEPAPDENATEAELSLGGLLSTGNARAASLTSAARLRIKRKKHQFSAVFAGNYGRAALDAQSSPQTTVGNVQGRLRYDYFVHEQISVFGMLTARHDKFQGLEARINVDPGAAFYLITDPKNRLWAEVGYDFQFDRFTEEATYAKDDDGNVVLDDGGSPVISIDRQRYNNAARVFGGYQNNINDAVTFGTGLEYLQSVQRGRRWRINWDSTLTAQLINQLAIAMTFTLRIDNDPAPGIRKVDTITAVSLIYRFF